MRSLFLAAADGLIFCLDGKCGGFSRLRDVDLGLVVLGFVVVDVVFGVVVAAVVVEAMSKNGLLKGGGLGRWILNLSPPVFCRFPPSMAWISAFSFKVLGLFII